MKRVNYLILIFFSSINFIFGKNFDTLNVKKYGAIGNGVTDDTNAFVYALNNLKKNDVLYIPEGEYIIKKTLYLNISEVQIIGEGKKAKLQYQWPKFSITKELLYGFVLNNCENVTLKNFSIDGGASNYNTIIHDDYGKQTWDVDGAYHLFLIQPIFDDSVRNINFENMTFSNSFFDSIHTYGRLADSHPKYRSTGLVIKDCLFKSIGGHGVGFNNVSDSKIINSIFENVGLMKMTNTNFGSGLAVDASAGCDNVLIQNNIVDGAGGGFKCESHHVNNEVIRSKNIHIIDNVIKNLYQGEDYKVFYGIKINGDSCSAIHNNIESYKHGILLGIDARNSRIIKNNILKTFANDAAGIRCDKNGGQHEISENYIINTGAQGILIADSNNLVLSKNVIGYSGNDNIRIAGGKGIDIASNYLFEAKNNNISIAPVGNMKIGNMKIFENLIFNISKINKPKGIFIFSDKSINNKGNRISKDTSINHTFFWEKAPKNIVLYNVGDFIINNNYNNDRDTIGWLIDIVNGTKNFRRIGYNN